MAKCPFNKFKECRSDCQLFREISLFYPDKPEPVVKRDCVFNLAFEMSTDYLHQLRERQSGTQKALESVRNTLSNLQRIFSNMYRLALNNREIHQLEGKDVS